jgi:hypothetical protein
MALAQQFSVNFCPLRQTLQKVFKVILTIAKKRYIHELNSYSVYSLNVVSRSNTSSTSG